MTKNTNMTHRPETYAYVVTDHDCDGVVDSIYSPATFAAQTYHDASEGAAITRETFDTYILPNLNEFERGHWDSHGFIGRFHGEFFRLPRELPTVETYAVSSFERTMNVLKSVVRIDGTLLGFLLPQETGEGMAAYAHDAGHYTVETFALADDTGLHLRWTDCATFSGGARDHDDAIAYFQRNS
jgi:hypothetical protein